MKCLSVLIIIVVSLSASGVIAAENKVRLVIVSSYHKEYLWSQATQKGVNQAMLDNGYLDNHGQAAELVREDSVESSKAIITKVWMNTKRRNSASDIAKIVIKIDKLIKDFPPDLVLLGDDNAAKYIGSRLLDTSIPVVFWGINGLPLKYGLVESLDNPGHNVTGVWQTGYYKESLEFLHKLIPSAQTFAILASDSVTARSNVKQIQALAQSGKLPLKLVDVVIAQNFSDFKVRAIELSKIVDAFFVVNHDTLIDSTGKHVDMLDVGNWYLRNINKPEVSHEGQFVEEGMLLTANDSGYNQGYRAFEMAFDILDQGLNPAHMRTIAPLRGPLMINRRRAEMLGINLDEHRDIIEIIVDSAAALNR